MSRSKVVILSSLIFLCTIGFWAIALLDMNDFSMNVRKNLNILGLCMPVVIIICFAILIGSRESPNEQNNENEITESI